MTKSTLGIPWYITIPEKKIPGYIPECSLTRLDTRVPQEYIAYQAHTLGRYSARRTEQDMNHLL